MDTVFWIATVLWFNVALTIVWDTAKQVTENPKAVESPTLYLRAAIVVSGFIGWAILLALYL